MSWIPALCLAPFPGRFVRARLVQPHDPARASVEAFIAQVYLARYGARLRSFLPHLLAYYDSDGQLAAAVGLRLGSEGALFVEQYLDLPAEQVIGQRLLADGIARPALAEVGNFAAVSPGAARELIMQLTCTLHVAQVRWVLFAATRQLRNAFDRLRLSPVELADARAERLHGDAADWGTYYQAQPRVMCGNVASGHAYLMQRAEPPQAERAPVFPGVCMAAAL